MRKKICFVCDGYWDQLQGGAEYQLYLMANELVDRGHEVSYVFVDRGTPVKETRVNLVPLKLRRAIKRIFYPYHFLLFFRLQRCLKDIKPAFVINRVGNGLTGICARFCNRNDSKMIWHIANETDLIPLKVKFSRTIPCVLIDKMLLNYGLRNSTYIIAQAHYQDEILRRRFGRSANLILPNFHAQAQGDLRKSNPLKVVWIANVKPKKQPEIFIELARSFSHIDEIKFIMIGRPESKRYQQQIEARMAGLSNLEYLGELPIEKVNQVLCAAHVFVNTSIYEGFPNTFIQAWMREVPVVSLHLDPDNVLKKNEIGFRSGNAEQMAKDVEMLTSDAALRQEMGRRARRYALEQHDLSTNIDRLESFMEGMARDPTARPD